MGHFACIPPALKKGWIFYFPRGKIEPPVGTQQPQIGGIKSSFQIQWKSLLSHMNTSGFISYNFSKFYGKVCVIS